jgi:hypothetical protein
MVAWLAGIAWTLAPSPLVDQSTPIQSLILIYGMAGLCMAATVAVITGIGITRLSQSSTKLDNRTEADQAGVMGSADAHVK